MTAGQQFGPDRPISCIKASGMGEDSGRIVVVYGSFPE